jgi:hypothetical protein
LPTHDEAAADFHAAADKAIAAYGPTVALTEGTGTRDESPVDSLARMTGRPEDIIVVVPPAA